MVNLRPFRSVFSKVAKNSFGSSPSLHPATKQLKEVRVPCPWGHISGLWYGREDVQPIVAVHGWLDNCGSWRQLAERIVNNELSLLALDLPGTGHSSHLPSFYNYHFSGSAAILRRVQLYYKFKDLIVLGHSGGAASCFLFSSIYSDVVKACILVDYVFYSYKNHDRRATVTGEVLDEFISLALKGKSSKKYNWNSAKEAWINGSLLGATNPELIEDLMEHGLDKVGNEYSFSRDLRLRDLKAISVDCFSVDQFSALVKSIACHICLIKASNSPFLDLGIRNVPTAVSLLEESAKSFQFHELEGSHHVHMMSPEKVEQIVMSFLKAIE